MAEVVKIQVPKVKLHDCDYVMSNKEIGICRYFVPLRKIF